MNLDKQPEISSIVLIDEYLDVDNKTVGKHPFVVLNNDTEYVNEKRYNIVAVALSSYKNKLQRKKNRIFNTSVDLFSPEDGVIKDSFVKCDVLVYFNQERYKKIGSVTTKGFNDIIYKVTELDEKNKLSMNLNNL